MGPINIFDSTVLLGGFGDDVINGGAENEILIGLWGNNQLFGAGGDDWLVGGFGESFLDGGQGNNRLIAGAGQTTFGLKNDGRVDTVVNFAPGVDRLRLQGGLGFGQLAIAQQGTDTTIRYLGRAEPSVVLLNVDASTLTPESFDTQALVPSFNGLTIFGDSLSDPGNLFELTGFFPPFPYFEGQFSNGDIWVDYLTDDLGFGPDQVQNFAVGGATTGRDNGLDPLIGALTGTTSNLPGLLDEVDSYLGTLGNAPANPDSLYVVWAGANDLFNLPSDPAAIPAFLANAVQNVATTITTLAQRGADTFLVPNLPNLGLTPRAMGDGNSVEATMLSSAFNAGLANALTTLDQNPQLAIDIIPVDIFGLTNEILGEPAEYGFTNVTDPLLGQLELQNPGFFWWDQQHPTTRVHDLLSDIFQSNLAEAGYLQAEGGMQPALSAVAEANWLPQGADSSLAAPLTSLLPSPEEWLAVSNDLG
ncbi:SGNH/GDSL hydrolase family protein [Nodosilinea nodulosa]|uniref:SGNH/GDSL hydrolase family protein n=1 Tax=Nodosilinea nodulosa TaxID=416001 RepID=UPI0002FC87B7|nr:SGNH/GDSL hydrolase family protein [Nodosilinea nodulosa]